MINKKTSVLIPDGEAPISARVINCLSEIKEIKIYVMSNDIKDYLKYSKYVQNFSYYPKTVNETDFIDNLNKEVEKHNIDLIMPIFDNCIGIILRNKNLLTTISKLAHLPPIESFNTAFDKAKLAIHLQKQNNIPFPKTKIIKNSDSFDISKIQYPVLLKPAIGIGGNGIYVFKEKTELTKFFNSDKFNKTYLTQEYIHGYDIDCSVLCKHGEIKAYTIQKGNIQSISQFESQYGVEFLQEDALYNEVEKLIKSLNWSGVAHIDMRYDEKTNNFKVIEVNPRFWGSIEASLFSGINFPYLYCASSMNYSFDVPKYKHIKFMNILGLVKTIKKDKRYIFKLNFIFNNTPLKYYIKDYKVTLHKLFDYFSNKIKS